ncbi:iron ABC transporter permease [uncultured Clostridium sp.]|uniref:FecCD family ABC transporter permease n=1 Tax=uncultured Clostridium sp. TaxID=59620 RepID=UPI00258EF31F|nr:iron ABC transporter permease [uncultured Clostridium sp.]MDU1349750.1 iron ABC transporter permease [Clostridium argentinense]
MDFLKKIKARYYIIFSVLILSTILVFGFCIGFGSVKIKLDEVFKILFNKVPNDNTFYDIVWDIRFPRALAALISGAALAVAGLLLQIFFKNPIVEPYVLGVSSGATLCVGLVMLGGVTFGFESISPFVLFASALIGSLLVMLVVVLFAGRVKSIITLLVIGLMVGYLCSSVTSILTAFADKERLQSFTLWRMGSFSGFTWRSIKVLIIMGIPAIISSFFIVKLLNAFLLGEEYAKSMGVKIKGFRITIIVISSILASVVTAFAGPVAFIGLAVPHITRLIFKTSDNKVLIPGTILLGGVVTSICDLIARTIFAPVELPISAVTSIIGAPIVIFLILKRRTSL